MASFRKRTIQKPIRGTRTSPHTAQVITSCGNPSLDVILGGGLPIGSICLIEEDRFVTHAKVLAKYFLAEGVTNKQKVFLGSLDDSPKEMLHHLPRPITEWETELEQHNEQEQQTNEVDKNGLRIAWRYTDLPLLNSEQAHAKIGHHFDLMQYMDLHMVYVAQTTAWDDSSNNPDFVIQEEFSKSTNSSSQVYDQLLSEINKDGVASIPSVRADGNTMSSSNNNDNNDSEGGTAEGIDNSATEIYSQESPTQPPTSQHLFFYSLRYNRLLNELQQLLRGQSFEPDANIKQKNLCRVCLTSLGSPLWYDEQFGVDLLKFLTVLRASIRNCNSVCFITMPMQLIAKYDAALVPKIRQLVDYAIELESFAGSERETYPAFKEYSGLLHLHKMTALNTLTVHMPETTDLAFKLRRKKFVIEKLHLPPELQESELNAPKAVGKLVDLPKCSSSGVNINPNDALDF